MTHKKHASQPEAGAAPEGAVDGQAAGEAEEVLEALPVEEAAVEAVVPSAEDALKQELAKTNDRYLRMAADFDNFRKRQVKERADLVAYANESMVLDILPVLDNLERALAAVGGAKDTADGHAGVIKGVELTMRMFQQILSRNGVERIKAVGQKFDPHYHEAIAQVVSEGADPETVVEEAEAGYSLNARVIRPAKVKVAKPPAPAPNEEEELKAKEEQDA
jgi:molecular chaperone GrpE